MEIIPNATGIFAWLNTVGNFLLSNILPAVIIAVVGILIIQLVLKMLGKLLTKTKMENAATKLIKNVLRIVMYVLLLLIIASKMGIDVTGIVALASVLTLAVSLALQNILSNVIGGFTLLYTKPFTGGDFVEIAGQSGTVKEVGLTYTKLATGDNKQVSIPNSAVVASQIVNFSSTGKRRVEFRISAGYDSPVDAVLEALLEAGNLPAVLEDPAPFAGVERYGDSAIEYILRLWCATDDYWDTFYACNKNIKTVFDARGITMTYPHINVHLDK